MVDIDRLYSSESIR